MTNCQHRAIQPNYGRTEDAALEPLARRLMADPAARCTARDLCLRCQDHDPQAVVGCNALRCPLWLNRSD